MKMKQILYFLTVFALSTLAFGQNTGAKKSDQPRRQTLDFEDELVEGETQKPELFYLLQKKNFNYKRLIKLRENFIPEMKKTAEDIQRNRSK